MHVVCILQDDVNMLHVHVDWLGCESPAEHTAVLLTRATRGGCMDEDQTD